MAQDSFVYRRAQALAIEEAENTKRIKELLANLATHPSWRWFRENVILHHMENQQHEMETAADMSAVIAARSALQALRAVYNGPEELLAGLEAGEANRPGK